jgi:hypothetical protein
MRCKAPAGVTVLTTVGAARERATGFEAFVDPPTGAGPNPYYHAPGWADPLPLTANVPISSGSRLRFVCTYDNPSSAPYLQGSDASTSEQCILSGLYYPDQGDDFGYCSAGADAFGTGAKTCAATRSCVESCPASGAPPPGLGLGGKPAVDDCWQRCIAASCPDASGRLFALETCVDSQCAAQCSGDDGRGSDACASCTSARCTSESAACEEDRCAS